MPISSACRDCESASVPLSTQSKEKQKARYAFIAVPDRGNKQLRRSLYRRGELHCTGFKSRLEQNSVVNRSRSLLPLRNLRIHLTYGLGDRSQPQKLLKDIVGQELSFRCEADAAP